MNSEPSTSKGPRLFNRRRTYIALGISGVHFVCFMISFLLCFGYTMDRFDSGEEETLWEITLNSINAILGLPLTGILYVIPTRWFSGGWGYIPFAVNSLIFGFFIVYVLIRLKKL